MWVWALGLGKHPKPQKIWVWVKTQIFLVETLKKNFQKFFFGFFGEGFWVYWEWVLGVCPNPKSKTQNVLFPQGGWGAFWACPSEYSGRAFGTASTKPPPLRPQR